VLAARGAGPRLVPGLGLAPEAVGLGLEVLGGHVVAGAPDFAGVGVAHFPGALVGQLDEALVVLAHRDRDGVPAFPGGLELVVAVAFDVGQDLADLADVLAVTVHAPLAGAVGGLHR